jgi:hypothetical protein
MASSGNGILKLTLDGLNNASFDYGLLHKNKQIKNLSIMSDLDVITSCEPKKAIQELKLTFNEYNVILVFVSQYDAHAWASFWISLESNEYIQVDFLCDPLGTSKYGICTSEILKNSVDLLGCKFVDSDSFNCYYLIKKIIKKDYSAASNIYKSVGSELSLFIEKKYISDRGIFTVSKFDKKIILNAKSKLMVYAYILKSQTIRIFLRPGIQLYVDNSYSINMVASQLNSIVPRVRIYDGKLYSRFLAWLNKSRNEIQLFRSFSSENKFDSRIEHKSINEIYKSLSKITESKVLHT